MQSNSVERLYIHFPFCRHLCNYCDFYKEITPDGFNFESFHSYLKNSVIKNQEIMNELNLKFAPLKSLYIGGGTPSLWRDGPNILKETFSDFNLSLSSDCEFTYELNPGTADFENLKYWFDFGLNRVSIGIQSLNPTYLKMLDRFHTLEDALKVLERMDRMNFNYSVDFMIGLPKGDSARDIIKELELVLKYNPSHMSVYILTTGKNYIHGKSIPNDTIIEQEYLLVADFLKSKGWVHYEVSNFAKPGLESKHNMAYWYSQSVAALGPSATGLLNNGERAIRYKWLPLKPDFTRETLGPNELRLEEIYLKLRLKSGLSFANYNLDNTAKSKIEQMIVNWRAKGLLNEYAPNDLLSVSLNSKGMLILDSLINELFRVNKLFKIQ